MATGNALGVIDMALHDLCQPMSALQCHLELASMIGPPDAYREAVEIGIEQCTRLAAAVELMRDLLRSSFEGESDAKGAP